MRCRGNDRVNPRTPKPGDQHDIEHMATFMPYVDVFFADQFFASIANQNNLRLGEKFNTTIRALPPGDIPEVIAWLEGLAAESDVPTLTERLDASIAEGVSTKTSNAHARVSAGGVRDEP
jgi:hypothetical protein